jgi:hypothetical protein
MPKRPTVDASSRLNIFAPSATMQIIARRKKVLVLPNMLSMVLFIGVLLL